MSKAELAAQQRALADLVRRATSLTTDAPATATASAIATGNARLSAVAQVDIYREQYFLRHVDVLREDLGSLAHLLGEDGFQELARAYLAAHPPSSFTLRDLGHAMEAFVTGNEPWADDPLLRDLARTEWAFVEAFDAPDAPPLDPRALASLPEDAWPDVRIVLQPSVRRLAMAYPAHEYRAAVRNGERPPRPEAKPSFVVVHRGPEVLHTRELTAAAYALLDELARGTPLGEACEAAADTAGASHESFQSALGGWFQEWTSLGWISQCLVQPEA